MGYKCIYLPCNSRSGGDKSLFKLPKDPVRMIRWLKAARREDLIKKNLINYKLCEDHFERKFISLSDTGIKRIYNDAIPTIFMPVMPSECTCGLKDKHAETKNDFSEKQTKQEDSEENTFQEQSDFRGECSSKAKLTTSDSFDQASEDSNFEPDETKVIIKEEPLDSDLDEIECKKIKIECESEEDCDEDLLFFKSLLPDFKLLSPEIKRELQGRIQEMVREATLSTTMHNF
ncbi:52 kDa repressor of the inhibitor of the protein kinase-like isoform X6 [Anthonomus grandis grandis]|uniref:52 kDa repressor of the inhibitor of the protein kinase-like isoform X6 n=1 Tax=Anthonomus grandis grandis TaxID=2921223 RepID=UPI002164FEFA|nr:52 kDa repressor of the inhibitor of the protein kinase-like isoform X6 [Anthonomus grandis grandis]